MTMKQRSGNLFWTASNARHALRYRGALRDPRRSQEKLLFDYLMHNADSAYGREHRFAEIRSVEEFQDRLPVVSYEELEPWIDRIRAGEKKVLTTEPVLLLEKTSGSSGATKYIPYTASLLREFRRAVGTWMFDLFTHRPRLLGGAQYWSLSPLSGEVERTAGGIPIGLASDLDYFAPFDRWALKRTLAVPEEVAQIADIQESRRRTMKHLVRCRDLRFISVWTPSFLTLLMSELPSGRVPRDIWPRLELISCWTSGASARCLPELQERFPGVEIQGKGLLATEGVVSFPRIASPAPIPAITSHFLEFLSDDGLVHRVDELEVGGRYSVLITTGGGLVRYDLGDQVKVVAPGAIEFIGRRGQVSDLCGEKLNEVFVGGIIEQVAERIGLGGFAMLAPEWGSPPRYLLFAKSTRVGEAASSIEAALRESFHYDYCRRLGQLDPVEGIRVSGPETDYLRGCEALGQRVGDVKPTYLRRELDWRERMAKNA